MRTGSLALEVSKHWKTLWENNRPPVFSWNGLCWTLPCSGAQAIHMEQQMMVGGRLFDCTDCGPVVRWRVEISWNQRSQCSRCLWMSQSSGLMWKGKHLEVGILITRFTLCIKLASKWVQRQPVVWVGGSWALFHILNPLTSYDMQHVLHLCLPIHDSSSQNFSFFFLFVGIPSEVATANHMPRFDCFLCILFSLTPITSLDISNGLTASIKSCFHLNILSSNFNISIFITIYSARGKNTFVHLWCTVLS